MKCRFPWLPVVTLCLLMFGCDAAQEPAMEGDGMPWDFQPNILWLVIEDQSANVEPYGDATVETPTISRLAEEGVLYTNVFSPSGVCAPSRAAIATGMYPNRIGAHNMRTGGSPQWLPEDVVPYEAVPPPYVRMHSELMRLAGYYTTNNAKTDYQFQHPVTAWHESSNQAHWRNREPGQPFFAIFNFGITHESQIWARAGDSLWVDEDLDVPVPPYLPDTEVGLRDIRQMYSNIKQMDYQVGQRLAELEEAGLLDSTIVFWYSDHGGPLPRQKRLIYDSGLHLPMIIRFPSQWRGGDVDDRLISFIDFMPTILSLAGVEPPEHLDGRAFEGPYAAEVPSRYIHGFADRFDERRDMIRAVRDDRFKYIRNFHPDRPYYLPLAYREQMPIMQELLRMRDAGELNEYQAQWFRETKPEEELFDTWNDPHELYNVADDPQHAEKLAELRDEMDRWMDEIDDKGLIPEPELIESFWPGMVQPTTSPPVASSEDGRIALHSDTDGASIGYQLLAPGAEPGSVWEVYAEPIDVAADERIVALAHRIGYAPSEQVFVDGDMVVAE